MGCYLTYSNSAQPNYVKTGGLKIILVYAEQSLMFQLPAQAKCTHFHKRLQCSYIKKIYPTCII